MIKVNFMGCVRDKNTNGTVWVSGSKRDRRRSNKWGNWDLMRTPRETQRAQCNYSPWGGGTRRDKGRAGKDRMERRRGGWVTQVLLEEMAANGNEGINWTDTAVNDGVIDLDNQLPAWKSNMKHVGPERDEWRRLLNRPLPVKSAGDGRQAAPSPPLHVINQRLYRRASSPPCAQTHSRPAAQLLHFSLSFLQMPSPTTHATTSGNLFHPSSPSSLSFPLPPTRIDWTRFDSCSPGPSRKCRESYRRKQIRRWL